MLLKWLREVVTFYRQYLEITERSMAHELGISSGNKGTTAPAKQDFEMIGLQYC